MPPAGPNPRLPMLLGLIALEAMQVSADAFKVTLFDLQSKKRSRAPVAMARQIAMYLAHVVGGLSTAEVSQAFERNKSTVTHACHIVEDRRDSPFFDREIARLETALIRRLDQSRASVLMQGGFASARLRLRRNLEKKGA